MKRGLLGGCVVGGVIVAIAVAYAAGDWSASKDKVGFKRDYDSLRSLTPEETRRLVAAVCEANEEDRVSVASDASDRVARTVKASTATSRTRRTTRFEASTTSFPTRTSRTSGRMRRASRTTSASGGRRSTR
jgi:gas vesicle protein